MKLRQLLLLVFFAVMLTLVSAVSAQGEAEDVPMADVINDEGGATVITGEVSYTLGFFADIWLDPYIVTYDLSGTIDRDFDFVPTLESQTLGIVTSDPTQSPFTYRIALPAVPAGEFRDVDNDGEEDTGVQTFTLAIAENLFGDPFIEERDEFFVGYYSVVVSDDAATLGELEGGKMIVWAPDDQQGFPSGYGEDGLIFTEDDPIVTLPQGYTIVDLSEDPFVFDRASNPTVSLLEAEGNVQEDYSDQSFAEAFTSLIELYRDEYAFTEYKGIDWDAKLAEFLPRFEQADADDDVEAYRLALRDFAWSIPDGHMFGPFLVEQFQLETDGGLGMAIRELDDGRVIVNFLTPGGPAEAEGIALRAEILEINGVPILEAVDDTVAWSAPFSTEHVRRLQQLRYVVRYPVGTDVEVTYQNPDAEEPVTTTLTTVSENASFSFSSFNIGLQGDELPVEFEVLDSGYGYVKVFSFFDDLPLTVELWERAMDTFRAQGVPGIILDMRQNGGGFTGVGYLMMSYFFDEELVIEVESAYDDSIDDFFAYEELPETFQPPAPEERYTGEVVVIISPACSSACEFVSRSLTIDDRAEVIGQYPTNGIAGGWQPVTMPAGEEVPNIQVRTLDVDGEIIIEGVGVEPTIRIPVDEETLFYEGDLLLDEAIRFLDEATTIPVTDGGLIEVGDSVTGTLVEGERIQYQFTTPAEGGFFDFVITSDDPNLDTVLNLYVVGNLEQPAVSNDDAGDGTLQSALTEIEIPGGLELVIEVAGFQDAAAGEFTLSVTESTMAEETEEAEGEDV